MMIDNDNNDDKMASFSNSTTIFVNCNGLILYIWFGHWSVIHFRHVIGLSTLASSRPILQISDKCKEHLSLNKDVSECIQLREWKRSSPSP